MTMDKKTTRRYVLLVFVILGVFAVIFLRLASLMIVEGEVYRNRAANSILKTVSTPAPRGEIYTRDGDPLARNNVSYNIEIMRNETIDADINDLAFELMSILRKNGDVQEDEFPIVFSEDGEPHFTYDQKIDQWKETYDLEEVANAKEAFEVLKYRYELEDLEDSEAQKFFIEEASEISVPISISSWKFREELNKERWMGSYRIEDYDMTAKEVFAHIREEVFEIDSQLSKEEARDVMIFRDQIQRQGSYFQYQPVTIIEDISLDSVIAIEENIHRFPGVNVVKKPIRHYPNDSLASHILGHVGRIATEKEIEHYVDELGYEKNDVIGKMGIEHAFEEDLQGKRGSEEVLVDSRGRRQETLETVDPVPGKNIYTSIDKNLQKKTENILEEVINTIQQGGTYETPWGTDTFQNAQGRIYDKAKSGSAVVLDVNTGKVLALANYPDFDPNLFTTGISSDDWEKLQPENPNDRLSPTPLRNIAISSAVQPGSVYKMVVGLAALEYGLDPNYRMRDTGYIEVDRDGNQIFGNWLWNQNRGYLGSQNLVEAIADSNNIYFGSVLRNWDYSRDRALPFSMSVDQMLEFSKELGLNDASGIEIKVPSEESGNIPSEEMKTLGIERSLRWKLSNDLRLEHLDPEVVDLTEDPREDIIDEIISWTDENPSRGELYNRLLEVGIEREYIDRIDGDAGWVDIIKYSYFNQAYWTKMDELNLSIGQGEHQYTPIQMANLMAIFANGGTRYEVSAIDRIEDPLTGEFENKEPKIANELALDDPRHLDIINEGMLKTTEEGTPRRYFQNFPVDVAGKTGTAQFTGKIPPKDEVEYLLEHLNRFRVSEDEVYRKIDELREENPEDPRFLEESYAMREAIKALNPSMDNQKLNQYKDDYDNYSWFIGFAPYEDPEIAVAVVIHQGGTGGYSAPIFREIVAEHLGMNKALEEENEELEDVDEEEGSTVNP
ncbi:penicillin-binding transpeptidase domain-containing protein [Isachenkonia alkalipeptolytica]|uniref:Penicillin-binding protein n=1 Tax=Isachenkonia alkalipeptolytica TaxID=2565777 RepID=A0AA43XLJ8_9CLOT|nr:penicillin-binding transpeptidase domain-containing protein [Isachenkonia alkalipeptolytica]NBG88952.1 penicillin-binding protein [Isachenkonia alkalipeptolytica]